MSNSSKFKYQAVDFDPESFCLRETQDRLYQAGIEKKIKIYSFFSGAGFLDLGFEKQGNFSIQFVNEIYLPFVQTYRFSRVNLSLPEPTYGYSMADISWLLEGDKFARLKSFVDRDKDDNAPIGFIGGPPCPDFSVGGKNKGRHGENGKLSETYVRLICGIQPDFFLFENVKGLYRTKTHRQFFDEMKNVLRKQGYVLTERLINALWYGTPQDRERILLVGFKEGSPRLNFKPSEIINQFPWESCCRPDYASLKALSWPGQAPFCEDSEVPPPNNIPLELTVQHWFEKNDVYNHLNSSHFFTPRAGLPKFKSIDEGDDKKKSYKRLHRWRYSPTAAYGNNEVHLHPYKARRLSVAETLAIQGLPRDFFVPPHITLSSMFKTVGNGVPFQVSSGISQSIYNFITNKGTI